MNNIQKPFDEKDNFEDVLAKYRAKNEEEIKELRGKLRTVIAEEGDKLGEYISGGLMLFFPKDDIKAAVASARHLFQRGAYYFRCAKDEYRAMQEFRRNYQDDINLDDLIGKQ